MATELHAVSSSEHTSSEGHSSRNSSYLPLRNLLYSRVMKPFLRYLELILTAAGVVVILLIFTIFRNTTPWKAAAICSIVVGIVHGLIFYLVRSKQRKTRSQEVFSIREMLDDMVNNRLNIALYPNQEDDDWRARAQHAVWEIQTRLNFIEAETLKSREISTPESGN